MMIKHLFHDFVNNFCYLQVVNKMESSPKGKNFDRRMTGASVIDEALHEVREATPIVLVKY